MPAEPKSPLPVICIDPEIPFSEHPLSGHQIYWLEQNRFKAKPGELTPLPGADGALAGYGFGLGPAAGRDPLVTGLAAARLPAGHYALTGRFDDPTMAELAFHLGAYRFDRYRPGAGKVTLEPVAGANHPEVLRLAEGATMARDLINTPANDLGPDAYEHWIREFAGRHHAEIAVTTGNELLEKNLPLIHAVGRAAAEAPRLIELEWGNKDHPKVTLVGKGVTFDTGGLNIKPGTSMALMKKDMGGSANILGLAHAVMDANLPVRLRVLLPVVENAISASSFRPGDVLPSRLGLSVEIGNTDAEGRLILADALALGAEEKPDLMLDMATLTGAARVALGPDLPALYCNEDKLADELMVAGLRVGDPVWRLPLWPGYERMLSSKVANINHISRGGFAGSITAALFMARFVGGAKTWVHLDIFAWAPEARAGRPAGGTDQGIRAAYAVICDRYK
ncbi:MAG: leucyl aminopeptidase family protein [Alphaproteobacteria bacterium]|nr:leucyl aminopeptidase family protein [Alphaproteobacteria bacterium]